MPRGTTEGLHPVLIRRLELVHAGMAAAGMPMKLTDGLRTLEEQQALYSIGRRGKPGEKKVTNADGVRVKSNHQAKEDGYGHAADCCFIIDGKAVWDPPLVPDSWWSAYGALARAVGLHWGIKIDGWVDRPHVELPRVF